MDDFWLDCCFNAVYEDLKVWESTQCHANRLSDMPHSAEL
jgi:hypothetical protein